MSQKVIAFKNKPTGLGLLNYIVVYLLMDKINPSQLVWGIVVAVCGIVFILSVALIFTQKRIDIFEPQNTRPTFK
jgi:hypothetical protein